MCIATVLVSSTAWPSSASPHSEMASPAKKGPREVSDKEREEELRRKIQRNRAAFEAWLEKKKEERKRVREAKLRALALEEERREQQRQLGHVAFQRWLRKKQEEDEIMKKEKKIQRGVGKLQTLEKSEERERAKDSFRTWKMHKNLEMKLKLQNEREERKALTPPARAPTPTLPGYCSVWECDDDLAGLMLQRVRRTSWTLSDFQNDELEQNYTITHS